MYTKRLEASVVHSITTQLENLGWIVDEKNPECNVFQQRAKTEEQSKKLRGQRPDFVLYRKGTSIPVAIIEAKRPEHRSLNDAMEQAEELYAKPLEAPLVFAYNDTYIETRHLFKDRPLKIDGEDVRQFVDHYTALRFISEGAEILSAPEHVQYSRDQLINIFKRASNLLREAGLQAGLERFGAFSDILFLKIIDEVSELRLHAGEHAPIPEHIRWKHFKGMAPTELHEYLRGVVWRTMNDKYGSIFSEIMPIDSPEIVYEIVNELSNLNLTAADTDVKGDSFEYFLKNAYQGLSIKDLGEYFTPRNIVRTMVSMVNPQIGEKIYDPFCGTGGFLIESFKYLSIRMKPNAELERILTHDTVYGAEITTNARVAKMNMILFGDGHSNIQKHDSFAHPKTGQFDIVLTNPPYSQKTRHGNLYPISSKSGDAVSIMHCFDSLNENGRAAILVKENFVSGDGDVGAVRDYIMRNAKNFSIVSLPRKLFEPYTPTKTSIVYFEKAGKRDKTYFYVIKNVGHTLNGRKKSIRKNDLPEAMDSFKNESVSREIESYVVENKHIKANNNSLWVYDYAEVIPPSIYPVALLGKFIEEETEKIAPSDFPDQEFRILGVSNTFGVFENEVIMGDEIKQKYKQVHTGDLVYNPHRVNVGSIALVTEEFDGGYVSGIYVVFRSKDKRLPPEYLLALLKSKPYIKVIEAYDTKYGAVRPNLTYEMLSRIRVPFLPPDKLEQFMKESDELSQAKSMLKRKEESVSDHLQQIIAKDENPRHLEDFNAILSQAVSEQADQT